MFGRRKREAELKAKINTLEQKINTINYPYGRRPEDGLLGTGSTAEWTDKVKPPQPHTIFKQAYNVRNATHRSIQCEENPFFYKVTKGVAKKLLSKQPYPFSYAKPYDVTQQHAQIEPTDPASGTPNPVASAKSNSSASADAIFRRAAALETQGTTHSPVGARPTPFGKPGESEGTPQVQYEIREDLAYLYQDWLNDRMFKLCRIALAIAFEQCVVMLKTPEGFWIFGRRHISKIITKKRIPYQVEIDWPALNTDVEEFETKMNIANKKVTYTIGNNCLFYVPIPSVDSPFGLPFILPMWSAGVMKDFGRFLHTMFVWNGGTTSYNRYPNTLSSDMKNRIEQHGKMGIMSPGINFEMPSNLSPENADKAFSHEEVSRNDINWDEYNSILSQDTFLPKSFIEEQVETGALGGSAPEMDSAKEKDEIADLFVYVDELVKLINSTFYNVTDTDYIVVPWQEQSLSPTQGNEGSESDSPEPLQDSNDEEKPIEEKTTETTKKETKKTFKANSVPILLGQKGKINSADGLITYPDCVLLPIGTWPYPTEDDPNHVELVDKETIAEYINDPTSVREGYFHIEHPEDPSLVTRDSAIGKYRITGMDERGMIGEIISKQDLGNEITLSNYYTSHDAKDGGLVRHRRIDFRNVVETKQPRMPKARGKKAKATMPKEP